MPIRANSGQSVVISSNTTAVAARPRPPLPDPDLDLVLKSYQTLKALKPDWAHAAILTAVADELKRAKRTEALDQFYKAAVDSSNDADSAASILRVAAERGDVDTMISLLDRYDRLVGTKPGASSNIYVYYGGYYTYSSTPSRLVLPGDARQGRRQGPGRRPPPARPLPHGAARRPDRISRRARAIASASASANSRIQQPIPGLDRQRGREVLLDGQLPHGRTHTIDLGRHPGAPQRL